MRIVSANVFCLNPRPWRALEAIAAQNADVVVLIEAMGRFDALAERYLPPRRALALPRPDGMPIAIHARKSLAVSDMEDGRLGWVECEVAGVPVLGVHMVAPYLPWRISRRFRQLMGLAERIGAVGAEHPGLAIGDFNTADFERAFVRFESAVNPWRRLDHSNPRRRGTWPFGQVWSPVAVDHAIGSPVIMLGGNGNGDGGGGRGEGPGPVRGVSGVSGAPIVRGVRRFAIPGSDHMGLVIDLPERGEGGAPAGPGNGD